MLKDLEDMGRFCWESGYRTRRLGRPEAWDAPKRRSDVVLLPGV